MSEEKKVVATEEVVETSVEEVVAEAKVELPAALITLRKCLEAGVHYGHHTRKWNPKMKPYIYGARNGIYLIDLNKSVEKITEAYIALRKIVEDGGKVLFVGTKKQVKEIVIEEAIRSGSFYMTNRWLGGTLTNFRTIQGRLKHLKDLEKCAEDGTFDSLSKKEASGKRKEMEKLSANLEGIKEMRRVPSAIVITDPMLEAIAVKEARKLKIPLFGIVDTNANPEDVDFPIPANDDATKSVKLVVTILADAIVEGRGGETVLAYTKDEEGEATMKDAIKLADKEAAEKLAAIRQARKEKQERYEKMMAEKMARREKYNAEKANGRVEVAPEVKVTEEVKAEDKVAKAPRAKKETETKGE